MVHGLVPLSLFGHLSRIVELSSDVCRPVLARATRGRATESEQLTLATGRLQTPVQLAVPHWCPNFLGSSLKILTLGLVQAHRLFSIPWPLDHLLR